MDLEVADLGEGRKGWDDWTVLDLWGGNDSRPWDIGVGRQAMSLVDARPQASVKNCGSSKGRGWNAMGFGYHFDRSTIVLAVISLFLGISTARTAPESSNFATVTLPRGVEISLPKGWRLVGGELNRAMDTSVESALDLTGMQIPDNINQVTLLRSVATPEGTYASVAIESFTPPLFTTQEASNLTEDVVRTWHADYYNTFSAGIEAQGNQIIDFYGVHLDRISGLPTVVTEYRRTGPGGPVLVQVNQVMAHTHMVNITFGWRESEAALWRPTLGKIRQSIVLTPWK